MSNVICLSAFSHIVMKEYCNLYIKHSIERMVVFWNKRYWYWM